MKRSVYTKLFITAVVGTVYYCKDPDASAINALHNRGFTKVRISDYGLMCDRHDVYARRFWALTKDSTIVKGCICSDRYKGFRVRTFIETSLNR